MLYYNRADINYESQYCDLCFVYLKIITIAVQSLKPFVLFMENNIIKKQSVS